MESERIRNLNEFFSGSFRFIDWRENAMAKLPDELEELKQRLINELDSDIAVRVLEEWYEEYLEDYEKLMTSLNDSPTTDGRNATHWALQNIS